MSCVQRPWNNWEKTKFISLLWIQFNASLFFSLMHGSGRSVKSHNDAIRVASDPPSFFIRKKGRGGQKLDGMRGCCSSSTQLDRGNEFHFIFFSVVVLYHTFTFSFSFSFSFILFLFLFYVHSYSYFLFWFSFNINFFWWNLTAISSEMSDFLIIYACIGW